MAALIHELAHALVAEDPDAPELDYGQVNWSPSRSPGAAVTPPDWTRPANSIPYLPSWAPAASLDVLEQTAALTGRLAARIEAALLPDPADAQPAAEQVLNAAQVMAV